LTTSSVGEVKGEMRVDDDVNRGKWRIGVADEVFECGNTWRAGRYMR
jgi:hypothetical protein